MPMTVMHNNAAAMALGETQKNNKALGKTLKKVASGMKINGAGNDELCKEKRPRASCAVHARAGEPKF